MRLSLDPRRSGCLRNWRCVSSPQSNSHTSPKRLSIVAGAPLWQNEVAQSVWNAEKAWPDQMCMRTHLCLEWLVAEVPSMMNWIPVEFPIVSESHRNFSVTEGSWLEASIPELHTRVRRAALKAPGMANVIDT